MAFISPELFIENQTFQGELSLYFTFSGKLTEVTAKEATKMWSQELTTTSNKKFHFIWDCSKMTGFEIKARSCWYDALKSHHGQIGQVTVIAKNILIRGAARVMLDFFGIYSQMVKSREQFEEMKQKSLVD